MIDEGQLHILQWSVSVNFVQTKTVREIKGFTVNTEATHSERVHHRMLNILCDIIKILIITIIITCRKG